MSPGGLRQAGALRHLRFSANGQYVLAQDSSRVTVLRVEPFAILFTVLAENATLAEFSPDSREVLFVSSVTRMEPGRLLLSNSVPHVERWSVAERKRVEFTEIHSQPCGTLKLSPNGRILACVDFAGALRLFDTASGETILVKKDLCRPYEYWFPFRGDGPVPRPHLFGDLGDAGIEFSSDGRFVLAVRGLADGSPFGWDSVKRKPARLSGALRQQYAKGEFVFVGSDQILIRPIRRIHDGFKSCSLASFPSGRTLLRPSLPADGMMYRAADPGFIINRPLWQFAVAAIEYRTGQMITSETPALDVFGRHYVAERADGAVGLYERGNPTAVAVVRLTNE